MYCSVNVVVPRLASSLTALSTLSYFAFFLIFINSSRVDIRLLWVKYAAISFVVVVVIVVVVVHCCMVFVFFSVIFCIPISLPSPTQLLSSGVHVQYLTWQHNAPPRPKKKKKGEAFFLFFTLYIQYPKTIHREWNVYTRKQLKVNLKSTATAGVKTASYAGGLSDCHAIFLPSLCDELKEHLRRRVESHGIRPNSLL